MINQGMIQSYAGVEVVQLQYYPCLIGAAIKVERRHSCRAFCDIEKCNSSRSGGSLLPQYLFVIYPTQKYSLGVLKCIVLPLANMQLRSLLKIHLRHLSLVCSADACYNIPHRKLAFFPMFTIVTMMPKHDASRSSGYTGVALLMCVLVTQMSFLSALIDRKRRGGCVWVAGAEFFSHSRYMCSMSMYLRTLCHVSDGVHVLHKQTE